MKIADDVLDHERLLREFAGDEELLVGVIDAFDREFEVRLDRVRNAIEAGDRWTLSREGHAFKGSVATFFARAAFTAANDLESDRDLTNATVNLRRFEGEVDRLRSELRRLIAAGSFASVAREVPPLEATATLTPTHTDDFAASPTEVLPPDRPASQIGRYTILGTLGTGGYGTVFKGLDERLAREVAIKVPRMRHASGEARQQHEAAFLLEARRVARLRHANVVTVHDVGVEDGRCYIVAEYLHGPDLTRWLTGRTVSWKEAVRIVAEVADGLSAAHAAGIVHRDVKPANILMTGEDHRPVPVLVDFGLALETSAGAGEEDTSVRGTPNYMPPEQARGENRTIDGRSDLYSLGVVLYRLLTGRLPFVADSVPELLRMLQHDYPVPPRQFVHHVPRDLESLCLAALAKDVNDRPRSAVDFAEDLRQVLRSHEPPALNQVVQAVGEGTGLRVLIAEDDEPVRVKLAADIRRWGHVVTVARDGEEAWELFQKSDFHIVITDWMMPRLDGLRLVERIRAMARVGYTYIVMLTSRSGTEDVVTGLGAGADDFLAKPCHRDELNVRLRTGRRIAEMTRQLADSNRRLSAGFEAAAKMIRARLPDKDHSGSRVRLAWDYRPAVELGGGLVHVHHADERRVAFHVVDVEGSGIPAALTAAAVSDAIRELAEAEQGGPARIATALGRRYRDTRANPAISVFVGELDLAARTLEFVNAGHPPVLYLPTGAPARRLSPVFPPLGVDQDVTKRTQQLLQLGSTERVLIHTRGVIATKNRQGTRFGERRLQETAEKLGGADAHQLVHGLMNAVTDWRADQPLAEDFIALVLEAL